MTRLEDRQTLIDQVAEARANGARQAPACILAGVDPRTIQRWRENDGLTRGDQRPDAIRSAPSHALTEEERKRIVEMANQPRFAETPPGCWPTKASISPANPAYIGCCARTAR
jgi:putative transposase